MADRPGALVISLDFELHWGVRDHVHARRCAVRPPPTCPPGRGGHARSVRGTGHPCHLGHRRIPLRLDPRRGRLPPYRASDRAYPRAELDPYIEAIGIDEEHDPEHLAASLVELIRASDGQEVASHTFSHYYCLEPGQDEATFRADLAAAQAIALRRGIELTSLVLPRNQWNPGYETAVLDQGFNCVRGPQRSWGHRSRRPGGRNLLPRGARLADTYVGVRLPLQRRGEMSCSHRASAMCRQAPFCARTILPASGSNLFGWLGCARDSATRRTMAESFIFGGTRTISRSTKPRTSRCSSRFWTSTIGLAATDGMESLTMADVAAAVSSAGPHGRDSR